jgi:two-component system, chemotaxis family, response regulator Rcp1
MAQTQSTTRPVKILLVEDDLGDATLTVEAFKDFKTPIELTRVMDGEEAISYLKKEGEYSSVSSPDLVLLDLNMPKKNGLEVLNEIKNDPKWNEIPVLILTCSKANVDILKAYEAKANFYLVKPPDLFGLYDTMKFVEEVWFKGIRTTQE